MQYWYIVTLWQTMLVFHPCWGFTDSVLTTLSKQNWVNLKKNIIITTITVVYSLDAKKRSVGSASLKASSSHSTSHPFFLKSMSLGVKVMRLSFPLYLDTHLGSSQPACQHIWEKLSELRRSDSFLPEISRKKQNNEPIQRPFQTPTTLGI